MAAVSAPIAIHRSPSPFSEVQPLVDKPHSTIEISVIEKDGSLSAAEKQYAIKEYRITSLRPTLTFEAGFGPDMYINGPLYIATCTAVGAAVGTGVGACCAGFGAGPGALTGAGIGLFVGIVTVPIFRYGIAYTDWKAKNPEAAKTLTAKLKNVVAIKNEDVLCPLTLEIANDPVSLTTCPQRIFERSTLEAWIKDKGTCPITRKSVTKADIRVSGTGIAVVSSIASQVLANPTTVGGLTLKEKDGVMAMQKNAEANMKSAIGNQLELMTMLYKDGKMSEDQISSVMTAICAAKNLKVDLT